MSYFQVAVVHYAGRHHLRTEVRGEFASADAAEVLRAALDEYYCSLFGGDSVDVQVTEFDVAPGLPKVYCYQCRFDPCTGDVEPTIRILPTLAPPSREALGLREGLEVAYGSTAAEARANAQRAFYAGADARMAA
jgi:hypothetical protein